MKASLITTPYPSYLSDGLHIEHRNKINALISSFADEKVTPQNMKILKLAYGFIEHDFDAHLGNDMTRNAQHTEESSVGLVEYDNKNRSKFEIDLDNEDLRQKRFKKYRK